MQSLYPSFDKLSAYMLDETAERWQISLSELFRMAFQDYLYFHPTIEEMTPPSRYVEIQKRTYQESAHGPTARYPCQKHGRFDEDEYRQLVWFAGKRGAPMLMRKIIIWWFNLPQHTELTDQLLERFEQRLVH